VGSKEGGREGGLVGRLDRGEPWQGTLKTKKEQSVFARQTEKEGCASACACAFGWFNSSFRLA